MRYLILLFVLALAISQVAQARQFELIKEHSRIGFDVDYMMMAKVDGQFKDYRGFFELNDKEDQLSNVKVYIVGDSVDTNDGKRDFHLKGHEFFFTAHYPEMIFSSKTPVKIIPGQKFKIAGELKMRGISKPVTLEGVYKGKSKDPWGKDNFFFTFNGEINRKDFDIVWNKEMDTGGHLVGDLVRLNIVVQSQVLGEKTPFSTHMIPQTKGIKERSELKKGKIKKLSTATDPADHSPPKN